MHHKNTVFLRDLFSAIKLLIVLCTVSFTIHADTTSATDGSTPLGLQPGTPAGSYPLSDFDNINLYNGNLSFQLALLSISGRGRAQMPVLLPIEGKWRVLDLTLPQPDGMVKHFYMPTQSWWENNDRKYRPGSLIARQGSLEEMQCADNTTIYAVTLTRLTFTGPDGTEYELRDQSTGGQPQNNTLCNYLNPPSRGRLFVTSDGSAATFISDTPISDYVIAPNPAPETYPSGYLMLRDGTRFRIQGGRVEWMRDRNGNKLTFGYDSNNRVETITDSLNRVVTISRNTGPGTFDQITYKGFRGATRVIRVNYTSLGAALRSDYASVLTYKTLFPELDGSNSSYHNPSVVSSITLPNNQQYLIRYNPYGEVARVVLPTGGAVEYDYAAGAGNNASGTWTGYEGSLVVYRRVIERRVYPDGASGSSYELRMTYSRTEAECAGCVKVDQFDHSGALLTRSKHYFFGNAAMSFLIGPTEYSGWKERRELQTEEFAKDGSTVLRRVVNTWQQPIAGSTWPLTQPESNDAIKSNNPQITQTLTTLEPSQANKIFKLTFGYDKYTNRTDAYEYDFRSGATDPLVRHTHTDYLTSGYDTINPSATNVDLNQTSHIRNLPVQVSVFDADNVERARATTEYDNYTLDGADCLHSFHCGLVARANISGLDPLFSSSYTKRGNATAATSFLLANGSVTGSVSSYSQYDVAGSVVRVLDPRSTLTNNIATTIEYDDHFGIPDNEARANAAPGELSGFTSFAFPTKITNALGHTSYAQFDYYLGQPVNGEDANGVVASGSFDDFLDRPKQIRRAVGTSAENQTTFDYNDTLRIVTVSSDRDVVNDNLLVSKVEYDQMGRTIAQSQYEGGGNYIVTKTEYDALGRPYKTSNPFRPPENPAWTMQSFDELGRVLTVTTPDNAVVSTTYSGNTVTVTDQAGKKRKSVTDALGRLTEVYEDPTGLNYQTSYLYDALDDLVRVTQGSQQRFFMYDSLKRLIRADNPEQETLSALSLIDPITTHSNWSVKYEYDSAGNLTFKTDARGVVMQNNYDALNRLTTVLYRINGQPDPNTGDIQYLYDNAAYGKGRLWLTYRWGAKPSHTAVGQYDAMGRVKQLYNLFGDGQGNWSPGYELYRNYNLAGAVTSQTYPSGHTVSYAYDTAGRTSSFAGNIGDGVTRTYASSFLYNARSQVTQELFGTQTPLYHKLQYNIRGQLWDVRVSTNADVNGSLNRGGFQYFYDSSLGYGTSGPDNNGNVLFTNIYTPEDEQQVKWAITRQSYAYDSLNRLNSTTESFVSYAHQPESQQFVENYNYDRWGNLTIGSSQAFEIETARNRLYAPGDLALPDNQRRIAYDKAGNQVKDTYTGYGTATFDGDNRIVAIQDKFGGSSTYAYNANAQRVRRVSNNQEIWQIYGIDGELVAEYAANAVVGVPQKEYGYRDGQLLITGEASAAQNVTWTNAAGVSPNGNSLTKTASTGWGNAGASSTQSIVSGDGYVEVTATETTTARLFGLSHTDADQSWTSINFAIDLDLSGSIYVFESGNNRGNFGPYAPGDKLQIAIVGGVVKYKKNGTVFYTSSITPSYPLVVDTALHGNASTLSNVVLNAARLEWLVPDHLGTPRIILDQTGAFANVKRHDYVPFGKELLAGTGGRTSAMGYAPGDNVRQQFTEKERDIETGLDYFINRYYSGKQGRFVSPDEFTGGPQEIGVLGSGHPEKLALKYADATNPQSLNKYQYCFNSPLRFTDPDGQNPQDSYELRLRRDEKALLEHKMTPEEFNARRRAEGVGAIIGVAAVVSAAYGPEAVVAIFTWASRNPEKVNQLAEEAVQASSGNPTSPTQLTTAEIGLAREGAVAALTGGRVARQVVKVKGLGSTDIDVIGSAGEYIAVGGPAKTTVDVGRQLQILKKAADEAGVKAAAYFAKGTDESVLKVAKKWLGKENVHIFEDIK